MTGSVSIKRWALLGLLLVLMSCSGGTGGSGSPVVAVGSVTEVGSVVVNGIKFDTAGATIIFNGQQSSEADLQLGQVVTVRGKLDPSGVAGTAESVVFENNAKGPIDSIDAEENSLVVLGQRVLVDNTTQFGDTPFSDLAVGDIVALSGFTDAAGALRATRVEKTPDALEIETTGTIRALDEVNQTFILHEALVVDYSGAELIHVSGNQLRNGQFVEVKSSQNVIDGVLFADRVEVQDVGVRGNPGEAVEIQGIVTRGLAANNTFEVNAQTVRLTPSTVFEVGKPDNIVVDARIEVEGVFDAHGIIVAEEVELGTGIEIQGTVTRGLAADNTFEIDGQLVRLTDDTEFVGGTANDIVVDASIEVEGAFDEAGVFVAAVVDFFDDLEGIITQGLMDNIFEVDGQPVRITPDTVFVGGTEADIMEGVLVEAEGFIDEDGVLVATEVDFNP